MTNNLMILGRAIVSDRRQPARRRHSQPHSAGELAAFERIGARTPVFPRPHLSLPGHNRTAAE